ncbi:Calcium-binding component of the spindle pole body (SPB) half-bridge [Tritrichomonas musculus]|uniref:Calcium-binding component of the spindle pole body (SPB) half-bridge n=1 Tax=Tritrichomonas musculus TaxID=1915356 RepID=A0ABR2L7U5_9EUKA
MSTIIEPTSPRSPKKRKFNYSSPKEKKSRVIPCAQLNEEQKIEMQDVFNLFDVDKKGYINGYELQIALRALGFTASEKDTTKIMKRYTKKAEHPIDALDIEDFYKVVGEQIAAADPEKEIRKAFNYFCSVEKKDKKTSRFDYEEKEEKFITIDILKKVMIQLKRGNEKTDEQLMEEIKRWDLDGDDKLSYEEFREIMLYQS